jgi:hypothetical protein
MKDSEKIPNELLFTRMEVAHYCKRNLSTIQAWTNKGLLTCFSVDGKIYYRKFDIELFTNQMSKN